MPGIEDTAHTDGVPITLCINPHMPTSTNHHTCTGACAPTRFLVGHDPSAHTQQSLLLQHVYGPTHAHVR